MRIEFSTNWIGSSQPRKQRKFVAKAPLHLREKFVHAMLSKELKKKYGRNAIALRKGDTIKVMRGSSKKKTGKVENVNLKKMIVNVEGIQRTKKDGSKVFIALRPSNLLITALELNDKKRIKSIENKDEKEKSIKTVKESHNAPEKK
jgi:large subunit ribosomal protein L24